ncbi:MAG: ParA family protein [Paludibacteraceae bacterium]|nr:ParA family protein [Paludibacteraceae bacterium]MBR6140900.1 ParA family protein [Bacteroidaceae bacterium]
MKRGKTTQLRAVIGIGNYKGGVGKTTTTLNLATALHKQGYRVMLIDMDRQANLSSCTDWNPDLEVQHYPTIYNVLCEDAPIPVYKSASGLYYCPSTSIMNKVDQQLPTMRNPAMKMTRALQKAPDDHTGEGLTEWLTDFDYILIDSPVGPQVLVDNILIAVNAVLIPINLEGFAMSGLQNYLAYIQEIRETENKDLINLGFLVTRRKAYIKGQQEAEEQLKKRYGKMVLPISISEREAVSRSQREFVSVYDIARADVPREEFTLLANEIIKRTKNLI